VLWASLSEDSQTLVIDYAEAAAKKRVRPAQLSFKVPSGEASGLKGWIESLLARAYGTAKRAKRAYVVINPRAGQGKADKIWTQQVAPLFAAARMSVTAVWTSRAGEAVELATAMDVDAYDVAAACGGDGGAHELLNGLAARPDARRALSRIALAHVPCGSGNAMSCNLYGTHRPSVAALAIIKGVVTSMDLVSVTYGDRRLLSFLSQAFGIVADIDLGTEHLRWMGQHRFVFGFLVLVMKQMTYPCDIAVKVEIEHKDAVKKHYHGHQTLEVPDTNTKVNGSSSVAGDSEVASSSGPDDGMGLPPLKYGTVMDKLPDGWELIPDEKLGNFYCGNVS
jgi:sphingosine kinase